MSVNIGEVNINLRLSLAQFSQDVKQGTEAARAGTTEMSRTMRDQTREAKAAMALLGEEIGVSIPRHLRTFIASLPGVASAMSAAFNSVAVLALLGVFVQIIGKVQQWRKRAEEAAAAAGAIGVEGKTALGNLDKEILSLQIRIADLSGKHSESISKTLQLINTVKLDRIASEFQQLAKLQDKALTTLKRDSFENLFGLGSNKDLEILKGNFDDLMFVLSDLASKGASDQIIYQNIDSLLRTINTRLQTQVGMKDDLREGLQSTRDTLVAMEAIFRKVDNVAANQKTIVALEEYNRTAIDLRKNLESAQLALLHTANKATPPTVYYPGAMEKTFELGNVTPAYGGTKEAMDLAKLQTDQDEALRKAQEVYTQTRTAAESFKQSAAELDVLFSSGAIDESTYNRALGQIKDKMTGTRAAWEDFGRSIGSTITQAALFGRKWSDIIKAMLADIVAASIQTAFFSAIDGVRAGGGPVTAGSTYLVGEKEPEVFTHSFVPSNGAERVQIHVDTRGAANPAELEMRVRQVIREHRNHENR